ncbi:MAG TPA: DMT family transporter [Nitrososphaerales archaeon]|nr:DMT family transporter [Nitrososphaerales archaeon]
MTSLVVLLGVAVAFCFGTSDFLSKLLAGEVGSYRTTVYTLALSGLFVAVPSLVFGLPSAVTLPSLVVLAGAAVSTYLAFLLMYRGYQRGNLSVVSPTVNSFPVFSVLFAILFLGVRISDAVLLALAGVIAGIILVSTDPHSLRGSAGGALTPGVPEAVVAALFFAVGFTLLGYADTTVGYFLPVVCARLGAASIGFMVGPPLKQDVTPFGGNAMRRVLTMGMLEAGGLFCFNLALRSANIGALPILTTLAGMGVVFTVGFAAVFLGDRARPSHAVGIALLVAGVATLLYLTA